MSDEIGLFEAMYNCRAMRRLSSREIPEHLLLKLVEAASQAPSASNQQRGRWIVVRDPAQRKKLADLNRKASEELVKSRIAGRESLPHHDADRRKRMLDAVLWLSQHMHEIAALVIACYEFDEKPTPTDMAKASTTVWPGVQNLLLAARALGLGAAPTTYGLRDHAAAAEVLGLPENVGAFCLIPVGYPLGNFGPVTRLPVSEVMKYDRWS